jgi:hypothetical protein
MPKLESRIEFTPPRKDEPAHDLDCNISTDEPGLFNARHPDAGMMRLRARARLAAAPRSTTT